MSRADYAPTRLSPVNGGVISFVEPGSPAACAGIDVGDTIVTADGLRLRDVLDWRWESDGDAVEIELLKAGVSHSLVLERRQGEPWGVDFAESLFDGIRTCENACSFCFMRQLPPGLRPALYVRDDDYRLSFLQGNFITLTNLTDSDVERIIQQHLSPLHVSLHAVTPEVRASLVCAREDRALERFDELVEGGIDVHVQIVLVPSVNDGDELDTTLTWLAEREGVASVGIVPVGYTRHQTLFEKGYESQLDAALVIQQVQAWQFAMRERDGATWVHLADEFYLNARAPFPTEEWYDGYPQYENGIGLVRAFGAEAAALRASLEGAVAALPEDAESVTIVTGVMAATTLAGTLNALLAAGRVRLLVVPNRFFGGNVSVAGLLTGTDLAAAIAQDRCGLEQPTTYLLPDVIFNTDGLTLDDMTLDDLRDSSGADVRVISCDAAGLEAGLAEVAAFPPESSERK